MSYAHERVKKSAVLSEMDKYVRCRIMDISGWDCGGYKDMNHPPTKLMSAEGGSVTSKLQLEWSKVAYPSDKYVKKAERAKLTKKNRLMLLKGLEEILEGKDYNIGPDLNDAIGSGIAKCMRSMFLNPKYAEGMETTKYKRQLIQERYEKLISSLETLATKVLFGMCDNPVAEFNKIEEVEW